MKTVSYLFIAIAGLAILSSIAEGLGLNDDAQAILLFVVIFIIMFLKSKKPKSKEKE